ncbi:MAG: hypothetical protein QGH76_06035 [Phycisphaerales bacterium]|jgi:hypothetical protein|nr:hypothetical protein [Phycisphaerales bacterium]
MRRRSSHESSLDLLLDTICNMFGMVIFIAVLAAVLARAGGAHRIAEAAVASIDVSELESLRLAIQELEVNDDEMFHAKWRTATEELAHATDYADRLNRAILTLEQQLEDAEPAIALEQMRMDIQALKNELEDLHSIRDVKLRTPRRRALKGRVPVQVVLTDDRFYMVNDWSTWRRTPNAVDKRCEFWSNWNTQAVDPSQSTFEDLGTCGFRTGALTIDREIDLREDGGIPLGSPADEAAIAELIDALVKGKHVVSFRVTPDSFDQFHAARRLVVGQGIEYDVIPIPPLGRDLIYRDKIRAGTATGQ